MYSVAPAPTAAAASAMLSLVEPFVIVAWIVVCLEAEEVAEVLDAAPISCIVFVLLQKGAFFAPLFVV